MPLLDPNHIDTADLLSLLRGIDDRLEGIEDMLYHIDGVEGAVAGITGLLHALIATEPGHDRAVLLAVDAVTADMADRESLIPVNEQDDEYEQHCPGCLLKKNGYPRLADLYNGLAPEHDHEG